VRTLLHADESVEIPFRTTVCRGVAGFVGMARRRKYWPPLLREAVAPPMEPDAVAAIALVYFTCLPFSGRRPDGFYFVTGTAVITLGVSDAAWGAVA
jgi:hypothetical protein